MRPNETMKKIAKFWKGQPGGNVGCYLCNWRCNIAPGKAGVCTVRRNEGGKLHTPVYGTVVSMAADPIEKKPLYHFWPGSSAFSIASPGCNFFCGFCQNWMIARAKIGEVATEEISPERLIDLTKEYGCQGIAHTYTEPTLWSEYAMDVGKLAHRDGLYNAYVSNGYITLEALEEVAPFLDAANVDVKAFSDRFYQKNCGIKSIQPVLDTCEWMVEHDIHLEVTYLIVPRENDSSEEIEKFSKWVFEKLGPDVPVHFSRFFPHYKMTDRGPTPVETLEMAHDIARKAGIHHVYIGNVPGHAYDETICYKCGAVLIQRQIFNVVRYDLEDNKCPKCGAKISIRGKYAPG